MGLSHVQQETEAQANSEWPLLKCDRVLWRRVKDALRAPHMLRRSLGYGKQGDHGRTARRWCAITPAMAAEMTDHVWTMTDLLSYHVPAAFVDRTHDIEYLFPSLKSVHQGN